MLTPCQEKGMYSRQTPRKKQMDKKHKREAQERTKIAKAPTPARAGGRKSREEAV